MTSLLMPSNSRSITRYSGFLNTVRYVAPAALSSAFTLTRTQSTGALSTSLLSDGVSWQTFAANAIRYSGTSQRLMIGGQRTNSLRNPRAAGSTNGIIGSGGVAPTNWTLGPVGGIAWEVIGTGTENGINYLRIRLNGTSNSTAGARIALETTTAIAASVGQTWTNSHFARLVSGSLNSMAWQQEVREYTSGSAGNLTIGSNVTLTSSWQRVSATRTLTDAGTTTVGSTIRVALLNATTYNLTVDIGWPQIEQGIGVTTPILPPVGTPGASTRGSDIVTAPLSSIGVSENAAATYLWSGLVSGINTAAPQTIFEISTGSIGSRYQVRLNSSTSLCVVASNGTPVAIGNIAGGNSLFRVGASIRPDGSISVSLNGGTAVTITGGTTSGHTTLYLGSNTTQTENLFGEVSNFTIITGRTLSNFDLQQRVAALT